MKTKHLNIESYDCSSGWFSVLPILGFRHKFWYLWSINFGWLYWDWIVEITRRDWKHKGDFDDSKDDEL